MKGLDYTTFYCALYTKTRKQDRYKSGLVFFSERSENYSPNVCAYWTDDKP